MKRISMLAARTEKAIFKGVSGSGILQYRNKQIIYSQGKSANTLFYIREGEVMLTIRSRGRRPAVITVLGAGDFFGQCCLAGVPLRMCTATAIGSCSILTIRKKKMIRILRRDPVTSRIFSSYLLSVIKKYQEHLVDLLVHTTEQRLARVLLQLAQVSSKGGRIPKISQGALANMVGTSRSRINLFMNRFRKRGFVAYNGDIKIHSSLRTAYLRH
ncbi:MAG TPA: Crp/Fnr family transcriptional regulator [Candidatus Acidoferrales bacterium]|nr:Crp/Fnr family transcriptional regulator [Candidatus Acidoferrales bacterium]